MAVAVETVARTYKDVVADNPINVPFPAFEEKDIRVVYGRYSLEAVRGADFVVRLNPPQFNTFSVTLSASLIAKIEALIAADPKEVNSITVRRDMDFLTSATPGNARHSDFVSREFDRAAMRDQQLAERLNRAVTFGDNISGDRPSFQIDQLEEGRALIGGPNNTLVPGPSAGEIANAERFAIEAKGWRDSIKNTALSWAVGIIGVRDANHPDNSTLLLRGEYPDKGMLTLMVGNVVQDPSAFDITATKVDGVDFTFVRLVSGSFPIGARYFLKGTWVGADMSDLAEQVRRDREIIEAIWASVTAMDIQPVTFASREAFEMSDIPLIVRTWSVMHNGTVYHYRRDENGTCIASANGVKGYPATNEACVGHWAPPSEAEGVSTSVFQRIVDWMAETNDRSVKDRTAGRYALEAIAIQVVGNFSWDAGISTYVMKGTSSRFNVVHNTGANGVPLTSDYVVGASEISAKLPRIPQRGDWVRIISNAISPLDRSRLASSNKYRVQEYAQVGVGSTADVVKLERSLRFSEGMATDESAYVNAYSVTYNARVELTDTSKRFSFSGGVIEWPEDNVNGGGTSFTLTGCYRPKVSHVTFKRCYGSGVREMGCLFTQIDGCLFDDFADNEFVVSNGYGVCVGGYYTSITNCVFGKARHAVTTLANSLGHNTQAYYGGGNAVGMRVFNCVGYAPSATCFDMHHGAVDCTFAYCTVEGGKGAAFGGRGIGHRFIGCKSFATGTGFNFLIEDEGGAFISGTMPRYLNSFEVIDCDVYGGFASRLSKVVIRNSIFRCNSWRSFLSAGSQIEIQGNVKFIMDDEFGSVPLVQPTTSSFGSFSTYAYKGAVQPNLVKVAADASLTIDVSAISVETPGILVNNPASCTLVLDGELRCVVPNNTDIFGQQNGAILCGPNARVDLKAPNVATCTVGGRMRGRCPVTVGDGVTPVYSPADSDRAFGKTSGGFDYSKNPDGSLVVKGKLAMGDRAATGNGTWESMYTTNVNGITFNLPAGLAFIEAPTPVFVYKSAGVSRGGYVEYDAASAGVSAIGGIRARTFGNLAGAANVDVDFIVTGKWKA